MAWPPDPHEVHEHDKKAREEREGQRYNTPPPPCSCGRCEDCRS